MLVSDDKSQVFIVQSERLWDYKSFVIHPLVKLLLFLPLLLSELICIDSSEDEVLVLSIAKREEERLVCHLHPTNLVVHNARGNR